MKTLVVLLAMLGGFSAQAQTLNCKTPFGKSVNFMINSYGISDGSGWVRANGESASSYYFRNGFGTTVIVNKSILNGAAGRIVWMVEKSGDEAGSRKTFLCN